jgi:purine-binding chemotaxis protein CheW
MDDSGALRILIFRVGSLVCGVPASSAREILPSQSATRIPGAPEGVLGLVNVRGALLTLFDGHRLLGQPADPSAEGAILVVDHGGRRAGIAVSEVSDLLHVAPDAIEPRDALPGVDPTWVRAVGHRDGRHFVLLDLPAVLAPVFGA